MTACGWQLLVNAMTTPHNAITIRTPKTEETIFFRVGFSSAPPLSYYRQGGLLTHREKY
jgi:hypothetical protein